MNITTSATQQQSVDHLKIMGGVMWLFQASPLHQNYTVDLALKRFAPSLDCDQFRYYEDETGSPIAFCNWAFLSKDRLDDILKTGRNPEPNEWNCGEYIFFAEMIAPFGSCIRVVRDLRENVFPKGQRGYSIRGQVFDPNTAPQVRVQSFTA